MQYKIKNIEVHELDKDPTTWCTLSIDETEVKAKIKHMGRGKFKILADDHGDEYTNVVIDASDVFHCK